MFETQGNGKAGCCRCVAPCYDDLQTRDCAQTKHDTTTKIAVATDHQHAAHALGAGGSGFRRRKLNQDNQCGAQGCKFQ